MRNAELKKNSSLRIHLFFLSAFIRANLRLNFPKIFVFPAAGRNFVFAGGEITFCRKLCYKGYLPLTSPPCP
jgi:hypothetical protein